MKKAIHLIIYDPQLNSDEVRGWFEDKTKSNLRLSASVTVEKKKLTDLSTGSLINVCHNGISGPDLNTLQDLAEREPLFKNVSLQFIKTSRL